MAFTNLLSRSDLLGCLLCKDAPCSAACKNKIDAASLLRSVWFKNEEFASLSLPAKNPCVECAAACEKACIQNKGEILNAPIRSIIEKLYQAKALQHDVESISQIDYSCLQTDIAGIQIESPFLLSSSVVASSYEMCARAFEAGWAGACFKTVSNLEIHEASPRFSALQGDNNSFIGFKNIEQLSARSAKENMKTFCALKKNYPSKLLLVSIMGQSEEEWGTLAKKCQDSGADAVELNFSCPNMAQGGLGSDIGQIPELVERFTAAAKRACSIPVIAKLTPNVASMTPAAEAAKNGGADGIAAINTIKSVTGINLDTFACEPSVRGRSAPGGYSGAAIKPIALRFIAELGLNENLRSLHISGMGGIESWTDAAEFILLGAGSVQITTAVMKYGYRIIDDLKNGLALYMNQKRFSSISEMKGQALDSFFMTAASLERDTILYPRFIPEKCSGCGRCVVSCADGGHQALELLPDRKVKLNPKKCVGCHLCVLVCPKQAISPNGTRIKKRNGGNI